MSKFIDKLKQVSTAAPQPMGFRATQPASQKPKIVLVASLTQANIENLAEYLTGADAGLLQIAKLSSGIKTLQEISQVVPDIPWGGWLKKNSQAQVKQLAKAGCDFVVFPAANTSLTLFQSDRMGKILEVESSLSEGLLRSVNKLSVDAVLIAGEQKEGYSLTWHHLMLFQRFADLLTKPLLVFIPSNVTANELQALLETGVNGVVVEIGVGQPAGRLKELRQIIDKLRPPSPRKREKAEALLPQIGRETSIEAEEEE